MKQTRNKHSPAFKGSPGAPQKSQEKAKEAQINHLYRHIGQLFLSERSLEDWAVLLTKLSNTMDTSFCVAALEEALFASQTLQEQRVLLLLSVLF